MFIHLHGHSTFSFLEAIGKPPKIVAKAKELGQTAIAITDYNGMFGTIKFLQAGKDDGIKPILGVELWFVLDHESVNSKDRIWNIVLLAETDAGYMNLMKLISFANTIGIKDKPKIDLAILKTRSEGLIALVGGQFSWLGKMLAHDESQDKIAEILQVLQSTLGKESVFLEITAQLFTQVPEVKKINTAVLELSERLAIPCIVNTDYRYIKASDRKAREIALDIKDGKKIYDMDRRNIPGDYHIMSEDEIRAILLANGYSEAQMNTWIDMNQQVADRIVAKVKLGQTLFPNYESPEDIIALYEANKEGLVSNE